MNDSTSKPGIGPVTARATTGAAIATIAVWIAGLFGLTVPPEVAAAFATLITLLAGWSVDPVDTFTSAAKRIGTGDDDTNDIPDTLG